MPNGGGMWDRWNNVPRLVIVTLAIAAMVMPAVPQAAAEGPWIYLHEPADGTNLTTKQVTVEGCSTALTHHLGLGHTDLEDHKVANMAWEDGALVMRPVNSFSDDFTGSVLNSTRWVLVNDTGSIYLDDGELLMRSSFTNIEGMGLIRSMADIFQDDTDWTVDFRVAINRANTNGFGGGITHGPKNQVESTTAVIGKVADTLEHLLVFADGSSVFLGPNDRRYHTYRVDYSHDSGECEVLKDGTPLTTFEPNEIPSFFWFGTENNTYAGTARLNVDFVRVWTYSGDWRSQPYDFGHNVSIDDLSMDWTSTDKPSAEVEFDVRASDDNISWSQWTPSGNVSSLTPLNCSFMQLRVNASLLDVRDELANVTIGSFAVTYRDPVVSVEARPTTGDWVLAEGIDVWTVTLDLEEDANVVQVRATDTSGATNITSLNVTVDTTPPVGTVTIVSDGPYLNDPDVDLSLNASDRYGLATVRVSNAPNMDRMKSFPYSSTVPWRLGGIDGEVFVYVQFVDVHGLVGEITHDSVILDNLDPSGSVRINDGVAHTASTTVRLDLAYNDNRGVATVEVSNRPDLSDALTIVAPQVSVDTWELAAGEDGPRTVYMRITDVVGNTFVVNATIDLYIPKALGNITIEGGSAITGTLVVQLSITAPMELGARLMQLSNGVDFEGATWEPVVQDRSWIFSTGDGHKTVYLRFEDFRGIFSLPVNASITVDTTPPVLSVLLEDGATLTTNSDLTATVTYDDASPPSRMWLASDDRFDLVEPQPFSESFPWSIEALEGDRSLYVMVEDAVGNTATAFTSIHYATIQPIIRLALPEGDTVQALDHITVEVTPVDPYGGIEVQVAFDDGDYGPWTTLLGPLQVPVPPDVSDGSHTIHVKARNAVGLLSDVTDIEFTVDTVAPVLEILEPKDGSKLSQEGRQVLVTFTVEDLSGISDLSYRIDDGAWMDGVPTDRELTLEMADFGEHTVDVRAIDGVGNPTIGSTSFRLEKAEQAAGIDSLLNAVGLFAAIGIVAGALLYVRRKG